MTWWAFFRERGQRPANWWRPLTPAYWKQLNRERRAVPVHNHNIIPCGHSITTTYHDEDGAVVRQDMTIIVGRAAIDKLGNP